MAYVGNPIDTQNTFQSLAGKRFSGDGSTTAFTLDVAPSSTLDIEVFVGNVRQDPNSAYTLSGTTLTFTGAPPSGTNNIYVVHQGKSVGTIDPPSNITTAQTFSGAVTASGGLTLSGTTPTLTVGDAGAEDAKIIFDGNAQDFHIGLDDSADDLIIGKGSALGTTANIVIDENGHVTKPLQPAFMVHATSAQTVDHASADLIHYNTEIFDNNADYNNSSYVFTAPVTGRYFFSCKVGVDLGSSENTELDHLGPQFNTSNRDYYVDSSGVVFTDDNDKGWANGACLVDMDANDTCGVKAYIKRNSGTGTFDLAVDGDSSGLGTWFCGYLVC